MPPCQSYLLLCACDPVRWHHYPLNCHSMLPAAIFLATQAPIHEHLIKQLAGSIYAICSKREEVFRARNPQRVNTLHPDHVIFMSGQ